MKELKKVETGIVPVYETSTGEKVVYGTELHKTLEVATPYKDWYKRRFNDIDAVEDEDYSLAQICAKPQGGRPNAEHIIKLDIAKEMAMLERNEKGRQVRRYFIQLEKKYKAVRDGVEKQMQGMMKFIEAQERFNEQQMEINEKQTRAIDAVLSKIGTFEGKSIQGTDRNPFVLQKEIIDQRIEVLNKLVDQVAALCGMDRSRVLHYMYQKLQEHFGISLNPYLSVMQYENVYSRLCNLHVIAGIDRFYETAVEMNQSVIERKKLYG